jgi:hypothetical protein
MLTEIGFWRRFQNIQRDADDDRPWPRIVRPKLSSSSKRLVIEYLQKGYLESFEFGYSTCRLCALEGIEMGCCSLTDGRHVWPEGLSHYVEYHDVELPQTFVQHALMSQSGPHFDRHDVAHFPLMEWNSLKKAPEKASSDVQEWIVQNTTLGLSENDRYIANNIHCGKFCCWS